MSGHRRMLDAGAAVGGALAGLGTGGGALFAVACAVVPVMVLRAVERNRRLAAEAALSRSATAACRALAAELRAGRAPAEAVRAVAVDAPAALQPSLRQAERLFTGAQGPSDSGAFAVPAFGELAAAWRVCAVTGAGLAAAVSAIAQVRVAAEAQRQEIDAALASAQASAGILALLPVLGLLGATAAGAAPLGWLVRTPAGGAAFLLGVLLDVAGLAWVRVLGERALRAC